MAKKREPLDDKLILEELNSKQNSKPSSFDERYIVEILEKDGGLNVMTGWNLGLEDLEGEAWRKFMIEQFNTAPNAICFVSDLFTPLNARAPYTANSYEKQVAIAIKTLKTIKIPVFLWPGVIERDIFKQTGLDLMSKVASYLPENKNFLLMEKLSQSLDKDSNKVFFDIKLNPDFLKNTYVTVEVRDNSKSSSRNVSTVINYHNSNQHTNIADIIVVIGTCQNAKYYPNLLCFGPVCSKDLKKNQTAVLNDSYYKIEVLADGSDRGYHVRNLQCKYSFNVNHQQDLQKLNFTALATANNLTQVENRWIEDVFKSIVKEAEALDEDREKKVHAVLETNKRNTKKEKIEKIPTIHDIAKKKVESVKKGKKEGVKNSKVDSTKKVKAENLKNKTPKTIAKDEQEAQLPDKN